ncbi:MAG TPA: hypothetical protein VEC12_06225 [Bacteroidia bacterium]|nr:hypothetical protein [Bacteroidia bacterium]
MRVKPLFICIAVIFSATVSVKSQDTANGADLTIRSGIIFNAEPLIRGGNSKPGLYFAAYTLWNINPFIKIGPEIGVFSISLEDYFPVGCRIHSYFIKKRTSLFLSNSLGYALSNRLGVGGLDWGGVFVKTGLGVSSGLTDRLRIVFNLEYYLQERKQRSFLSAVLDSEMQHFISVSGGLSFKL